MIPSADRLPIYHHLSPYMRESWKEVNIARPPLSEVANFCNSHG